MAGAVGVGVPASAVTLTAPANLAPVSGSFGENPALSWDRVTGATNYSVQVATAADFATVVWSSTTVNQVAVPTVTLPAGPLHWRVRAQAGTSLSEWAVGGFTRDALPVPTGLAPADGTSFPQPAQPAQLSWQPVAGAVSYTLEVGDDAAFNFVVKTVTTKNLSTVVSNLLNKTYYWRVRANLTGTLSSAWSPTRTFVFGTLPKPVLVSPAQGSTVDEPILSWQPVPGAATYELQVSKSSSFTTSLISQKGILASSYAPPTGFAKGTYYWRVRPFDGAGDGPSWSAVDTWVFARGFTAQAGLQYPGHGTTVTEPVYFQWTPARLAQSYTLQLSTSSGFSPIYDSCTTVHTTYTPTGAGDCWPAAGGTYYWRVIGSDGPTPLSGSGAQSSSGAQVRWFTYNPPRPALTSPLSGSVSVPTLRWEPVNGAAQYQVTIVDTTTLVTTTVTTRATSYTPPAALPLGSYRWQVQTVSRGGELGAAYAVGEQPTFTLVAQAAPSASHPTPTVGAQTGGRFPSLAWQAVTNATSYRVQVKPAAGSTWSTLPETYVYPAGEDAASSWAPGSYDWRVTAYNGVTALTTSASLGSFTIGALSAPSGHKTAMTGTATGASGTSCSRSLGNLCQDLRQTPVLAWNTTTDAVYYRLHLAKDAALTQPVAGYPMSVDGTRHMPVAALSDTTGSGVYYWAVQACRTASDCTVLDGATHGFTKTSKPVQLLTPADGEMVNQHAITLTWRPYVETNQDLTAFPIADSTGVQSVAPGIEASQYRLQVASDSGFDTVVTDVVVNQTQYTAPTTFLDPGTYYWRVRAIAADGTSLPWSSVSSFTKRTPIVQLVSPVGGAAVSGSLALVWTPQAGVTSYDVELYKDADAPVRMTLFHTSRPIYVPSTPLPVSAKPYVWRVRPIDTEGRLGRWSVLGPAATFTVTGEAPSLVAPADDVMLPNDGAVFSWTPVPGAAKYRWEWRNADTNTVKQRVGTVATSYAPPAKLSTGSWEWRVVTLDTGGKLVAGSGWRTFRADSTGPKVRDYTPASRIGRTGNVKVTFDEKVLNATDETFTMTASGAAGPIAATVTVDATRKIVTLNPASALIADKKYTVRLSGITDDHGNAMKTFSWTITAN